MKRLVGLLIAIGVLVGWFGGLVGRVTEGWVGGWCGPAGAMPQMQ